ncbi:MAG: hypothetical protein ACRCUQ_03945 [Alphaproteobacteria bacterium]
MDKKSRIAMMALWGILVQPVQAAPEPPTPGQPNKIEKVLEGIDQLDKKIFCSAICNPLFFPPILCQITEIKAQCLDKCPGVTHLDGKKIDLTGCKKAKAKPFEEVAEKTKDNFCKLACTSLSCSNYRFTIRGTEIFFPGEDFGKLVCKNLCKRDLIKGCLRKIEGKPIELP